MSEIEKEVLKEFDKQFTARTSWENWSDSDEIYPVNEVYKWKDDAKLNPALVKSFLSSALQKAFSAGEAHGAAKERERIIIELKRVADIGVDADCELRTVTIPALEALQTKEKGQDAK